MTHPLQERVAVVTGASSGIGRAIAVELLRGGASVVANARGVDRLASLRDDPTLGDVARCLDILAGDAAAPAVIESLLTRAQSRFGPADLVVVNAVRGLSGSVLTSDPGEWEEMVRTNLTGAMHMMRAAALRMMAVKRKANSAADIVVIGSTVGRHISPFSSAYGGTKFAIGSVAEAMRRELAPANIRVTLIEPGIVRSGFQKVAGYTPDWFDSFAEKIGPVLEPEDVARTVAFIVSQPAHVHINDVVIRPTRQDYP